MALTLLESAKLAGYDVHKQAIVEIYAQSSDILRVLPFTTINGGAYRYDQESVLPGIAFRGVNEGYTESTGMVNPQTEQLVIMGGDVDVDNFITQTQGMDRRAVQESMQIKHLAHFFTYYFIKGSSLAVSKQFDGLQVRLTGNQLVANGSTSGGDVLSLAKLDELIDAVVDPTHLIMSKAVRRSLTAAARLTTVGGYVTYDVDEFGRQVTKYNDLPILLSDGNSDYYAATAFNEANPGGGSAVGTSIYCASLQEGKLTGLQSGEMQVSDLGEQDSAPVQRTRVEWYVSLLPEHPKCAARLWGIKAGAVAV